MDDRKVTFGRSASMPLLQQQLEQMQSPPRPNEVASEDQYRALQGPPGFQHYRNMATEVWAPPSGFTSPFMPANGAQHGQGSDSSDNGGCPISSEHLTSADEDVKGTLSTPSSPDSEATIVPGTANSPDEPTSFSLSRSSANAAANATVFQPQHQPGMYASASSWNSIAQSPASPSGSFTFVNHSHSASEGSEDSQGCKTPSVYRNPNHGSRSPLANSISPPKDIKVAAGTLHLRRRSSRLSSLPAIPSPLGPGHWRDDLGSDVSGLVSPLPTSPATRNLRQDVDGQNSPRAFGRESREVTTDANGSPQPLLRSFSGGHARMGTDPFVDYVPAPSTSAAATHTLFGLGPSLSQPENRDKSEGASSSRLRLGQQQQYHLPSPSRQNGQQQKYQLPLPSQIQVPVTPTCQPPSYGPQYAQQYAQRVPETPTFHNFLNSATQRETTASHNIPSSRPAPSPFTPSFSTTNTQGNHPIPPPPLPCAANLTHTPATRALLDSRKAARAEWIRAEAAKIASLSRLSFAAAQQYQATGKQEDYETWQRLAKSFDDATDLEKRQTERREMFFPVVNGVKTRAIKTSDSGDVSASYQDVNGGGGGARGEGGSRLLGFKMALLERVGHEAVRKEQETKKEKEGGGEEGISEEMLGTLSVEEKKALRKHLVGRLERGGVERKG